ncbi:MAG: hypothetical protein DRN35_03505 [Thermoplasmata archaeon]|nr:MAG: hypothetical protein DRN35_03505 [Thermoplasmata archaeon]RLF71924.1 MAG: hypothetical protein DRN55_06815 [Thermoplasmata archaeon]
MKRIRTGIPGFDNLIEGGFISPGVYMVSGAPGAGKTTFGMHFLMEGIRSGERCLYMTLTEDPKNIIGAQYRFFPDLIEAVKEKDLLFADVNEVHQRKVREEISLPDRTLMMDVKPISGRDVISLIQGYVEDLGITRIVVDSLALIGFSSSVGESSHEALQKGMFVRILKELDLTVLLISEMLDPDRYSIEHYIVHGIVLLHHFLRNDKMMRALQIIKMRGTKHDDNLHPLTITSNGLSVGISILKF